MSQPYNWPSGVKTEHEQYTTMPPLRRSGSGDEQSSLAYVSYSHVRCMPRTTYHSFIVLTRMEQDDAQRRLQSRTGMRPHSSSTSSLSGAMGDAQIGVQPRTSHTPPTGLPWTPSPTSSVQYMPAPEEMSYLPPGMTSSSSSAFAAPYGGMPMYPSPETSPGFSSFPPYRGPSAMVISPSVTPAPPRHSHSPHDKDEEVRQLRERIHHLQIVADSSRRRVRELEAELSRGAYPGGLPSPLPTPAAPPTFQEEWNARTEARVKLYCSLNRAGNALCAWHDSRRERRKYPPRMAPPGELNCGCTFEEALFEESLSRHEVGSYLPGERVRMDPALRNPLLQLLQKRYGYRDGDFERDPRTGNWLEGEGAARWEQQLAAGMTVRRRQEADRR